MFNFIIYLMLYAGLGISFFCLLCILFSAHLKFKFGELEIEIEGKLFK